jgi:hypothetical protein
MTSQAGQIIPKYLIFDTEREYRELSYLTHLLPLGMVAIGDGNIYRMILDCLHSERDAEYELEFMGLDYAQQMNNLGYGRIGQVTMNQLVALGRKVFQNLKSIGAYHNGYLIYCYHDDCAGDLTVVRYSAADLAMHQKEEEDDGDGE